MDNRPTDLNSIALFAKVVELCSFRGAAKVLGMPRSTVSAKVAELEAVLGVRLLDRTTRTVRPTESGTSYLRFVGPALASLVEAKLLLHDLQTAPSGLLRITAPPELGHIVLGPVLAAYRERAPDVTVSADLTGRHVHLINEGFDVALRAGELADSSLIARKIGPPQAMHVCASPAYLRRRGIPRHPRELASHECLVMTEAQHPERWRFRDGRRRFSVDVRGHVALNSFAVLRDLAISGHGIVCLPELLARPALATRKLHALLEPFVPLPTSYHVVYASSRSTSVKVRLFVDVFSEVCDQLFVALPA